MEWGKILGGCIFFLEAIKSISENLKRLNFLNISKNINVSDDNIYLIIQNNKNLKTLFLTECCNIAMADLHKHNFSQLRTLAIGDCDNINDCTVEKLKMKNKFLNICH